MKKISFYSSKKGASLRSVRITVLLAGIAIFAFFACSSPVQNQNTPPSSVDYRVYFLDKAKTKHSIDIGSTAKNVFLIATNANTNAPATLSGITLTAGKKENSPILTVNRQDKMVINALAETDNSRDFYAKIQEFNRTAMVKNAGKGTARNSVSAEPQKVGDKATFYNMRDDGRAPDKVEAICKAVRNAGGKTLYIYVDDKYLKPTVVVKDADINNLADAMLKEGGSNNDIYHLVTTIFGAEWGEMPVDNVIPNTDEITILMLDLSPEEAVGMFYSRDNFNKIKETDTPEYLRYSNQRVMFYLDAQSVIDDFSDAKSTLAHEFQHMINFYQKAKLNPYSNGTESWINEMLSVLVEDILAETLLASSPRGVTYAAPAPAFTTEEGRLPLYNTVNYKSVNKWLDKKNDGENVLESYAISYAFGAYLAHNFGGVQLLQKIVQCKEIDYMSIVNAVNALGFSETFDTLLQKWAIANLLSDIVEPDLKNKAYLYNNRSNWLTSTINGITYNIGSINLWNYAFATKGFVTLGPRLLSLPTEDIELQQASNNYFFAGRYSGTIDIVQGSEVPEGVQLTVVIK